MTSPLENLHAWAKQLAEFNETTLNLGAAIQSLASIPTSGVAPADLAATLVSVWQQLGLDDPSTVFTARDGAVGAMSYRFQTAIASVGSDWGRLTQALEAAMATAVRDAGAPEVVRSADFSYLRQQSCETEGGLPRVLMIGALSALPPGHYLRSALPQPGDFYQADSDGPALILGIGTHTIGDQVRRAKPWYLLSGAVDLTRKWREGQRRVEKEHREKEESLARERAWSISESPAARDAALKNRVAELERRLGELVAAGKDTSSV